MKRISIVSVGLLFFGSACRESSDRKAQTVIGGNWTTSCFASSGPGSSSRILYQFQGDHSVVRTQSFFLGSDCARTAGNIRHLGFYSLEVLVDVSIYNIDMVLSEVNATALSMEGVTFWNAQSLCDLADWDLNSAKNILGSSVPECLSFGTSRIVYRDRVEVSEDQRLSFAATLADAQPRPVEFPAPDPARTFVRVLP